MPQGTGYVIGFVIIVVIALLLLIWYLKPRAKLQRAEQDLLNWRIVMLGFLAQVYWDSKKKKYVPVDLVTLEVAHKALVRYVSDTEPRYNIPERSLREFLEEAIPAAKHAIWLREHYEELSARTEGRSVKKGYCPLSPVELANKIKEKRDRLPDWQSRHLSFVCDDKHLQDLVNRCAPDYEYERQKKVVERAAEKAAREQERLAEELARLNKLRDKVPNTPLINCGGVFSA
jgi:hypothetical protein